MHWKLPMVPTKDLRLLESSWNLSRRNTQQFPTQICGFSPVMQQSNLWEDQVFHLKLDERISPMKSFPPLRVYCLMPAKTESISEMFSDEWDSLIRKWLL